MEPRRRQQRRHAQQQVSEAKPAAGDVITIRDLEVFYRVGVPAGERARPQRLLLTVELETDFSAAAQSDALGKTIDYNAVARRLLAYGSRRSWKLLETLAVELVEWLIQEHRPARVTVEIKKFVIPRARHVSVRVTRPR